jgi:predicted DCC family thiol-disulfide oxidoreductase YuxK
MLEGLGQPWSWISVARILPLFIRDPIYDLIARNRFRMFGRRDVCFAPTPEIKDLFL